MIVKIMSWLLIAFAFANSLYGQSSGVMWITSSVSVHFIVTDPQGHKTGRDPRGSSKPWIGIPVREIPNASYSTSGLGDSPENYVPEESDNWHEFSYEIHSPDNDGTYQIDCIGWKLREFTLYAHLTSNDTTKMQEFRFKATNVIDTDEVISYRLEYHGRAGSTIKFEKIVTSQIIRHDLDNCFKLKLLDEAQLYDSLGNILTTFEQSLANGDSVSACQALVQFKQTLTSRCKDTVNTTPAPQGMISVDAWNILQADVQSFIARLPVLPPGFTVKLVSSTGTRLTTGSFQYYEASWKDATNNNDGTFSITTTAKTLSLRMTYEYGTQTKSNVTVGSDTAVFQTVNVQVQLKNSQGNFLDTGSVQYYAGVWRNLGITSNGVVSKELLPNNCSFRMTYAGGSNDKQQDIGANPTVVFQTVNTTVQLKNSQGNLIDTGTVQYYAGAWRSFGTTTGGVTTKELLPNNYSFRMTCEGVSNDKAQDIPTNGTVAYSTVLCTVRVKDSQGQPVNNIQASYYSGAWRQIGPTVNGQVTKELLPANLTFRITYGISHQDKTQNLPTSNVVEFIQP